MAFPRHIAIIMDGNGRWAQQRGLPRHEGHQRGVETARAVTELCADAGIEQLTLYCLSSENWKRPRMEIEFLMRLLKHYLVEERPTLQKNNIRLAIIGSRDQIPEEVLDEMDRSIEFCSRHTGMCLCLAINYGSRREIVGAARKIAARCLEAGISRENIADLVDEEFFASHLDTVGMPEPDLLIRTAGEMRLSNFLLWQLSYAEIWVTQTLWPDFDREQLRLALESFARRRRRFGGLEE